MADDFNCMGDEEERDYKRMGGDKEERGSSFIILPDWSVHLVGPSGVLALIGQIDVCPIVPFIAHCAM